jgi:hypothetical protein
MHDVDADSEDFKVGRARRAGSLGRGPSRTQPATLLFLSLSLSLPPSLSASPSPSLLSLFPFRPVVSCLPLLTVALARSRRLQPANIFTFPPPPHSTHPTPHPPPPSLEPALTQSLPAQPYKDPQYKEVPDRPGFYGVVHATRDREAQ